MKHCMLLAASCALVGCSQGRAASTVDSARSDSIARANEDSVSRARPGYVVDSILPPGEQLRRFRAGLTPERAFAGGARSRADLMRVFARSLAKADTTALLALTISKAEFAWLVYPDSPLSGPPYRQAADLVWMRHTAASSTGLSRLLARLGGAPLQVETWSCSSEPQREGRNRIWRECSVRLAGDDSAAGRDLQLFSSIIEREGRFKILSYSNAF